MATRKPARVEKRPPTKRTKAVEARGTRSSKKTPKKAAPRRPAAKAKAKRPAQVAVSRVRAKAKPTGPAKPVARKKQPRKTQQRGVKAAPKATVRPRTKPQKTGKKAPARKTAQSRSVRRLKPVRRPKSVAPVVVPPSPAAAPRPVKARTRPAPPPRRAPSLDRVRRTVPDDDALDTSRPADLDRSPLAIRAGRDEQRHRISQYTQTSPEITGGDVDADWESADSVGDEAPGGDNPTPDQDVVDEIGHAIGLEYDDDEELDSEEKLLKRDRDRWELDPASSDDFEDR